ncbi:hypothetical protein EPUS_09071 [Endocarpon pusillum Z07020]|uniref:MINDY deubiquitinase domain-containing protein n=1 Tax=Endocarpon pusillum (strain Z07020 / HMAS-L-300199) TaxID=1263415 RepID=U1HJZ4_ENDPU|nr:uncharacterized protein EPUS_09071 [Endocarpon pusillum Z07020]ERF69254.1 hypothetical protein EPUS_09071 [Endocarpon pusillum Z07020]
MVVRKSTPAGAFTSESTSSHLSPASEPASLTSSSYETVTRPSNSTSNSYSSSYHHPRPNPILEGEEPASGAVNFDYNGGPSAPKGGTDETPLPVRLQAGGTTRSLQNMHTGLPDTLRACLSGSGKATPRSSMDSERSRDFWEEDVHDNTGRSQHLSNVDKAALSTPEPISASLSPSIPGPNIPKLPHRSNNPFRQGNSSTSFTKNSVSSSNAFMFDIDDHKATTPETPVEMTANLSLVDRPFSEYSTSFRPSTLNLNSTFRELEPEQTSLCATRAQLKPSTLRSPSLESPLGNHQSALIPVASEMSEDTGSESLHPWPWNAIGGSAQDNNIVSGNARSSVGVNLEKELPATPSVDALQTAKVLLPAERDPNIPLQGPIPSQGTIPQKPELSLDPPPTPSRLREHSNATTEAEMSKLREHRNETYQIKHFNWFDHNSRTLRRSSMLTQNKNGPCPLLALVNALILGGENDTHSALGAALRTREQVSLGLIIESLLDELTSEGRGGQLTELPDVDELNGFLLRLHTGMTANPRLASHETPSPNLMDARNSSLHLPLSLNNDRKPGIFENTHDMRLYGAFNIPLVHGWLAPRSDPARAAFARSAQTYEDAQTIQFREEELEDKLSRVGLTSEEQQLLQDISSIKSFLESYPTQITPYGLEVIYESLYPAGLAILFRNDHFSTIYKHPESGQLFTLVTDAGYSDRDEVIWESLVDVSGQNSEFFSGDFRPIGNLETTAKTQQTPLDSSSTSYDPQQPSQLQGARSPASFQEQQQQADADFAMALQLQEEEEARLDDPRRRSNANDTNRSSGTGHPNRPGDQEATRPAIPPRNSHNQGVTRPVDPSSDEAPPPAYEEAAKGKPYLPPTGHPQHPSFHGRSPSSGPSTPVYPPARRQAAPRRMSAFQETSQFQPSPPLTRPHTNNSLGVSQSSGRSRDREKDCIVM